MQDDEKPLQSGTLENLNKVLSLHSIAEYLPYETYNPDTEIYECKGAKGIVLEANPMVGASDNNVDAFYALLQRILPEGTIMHCLLYASPYLGRSFDAFIKERQHPHPLIKRLAEKRIDFYKKGVHETLIPGQKTILRDYQLLVCLVFDNALGFSDDKILSLKNSLISTLKGSGIDSFSLPPEPFMQWIDALLRPSDALYPESFHWNELDTIAHQLGAPHCARIVTPSKMFLYEGENEGKWQIRNF
ncbi:MAG TPA: TraC family protein, partial [Acinetobacter sp.]|nr:TraC family protein [Acinetobacter sp.]